MGKKDPRVDAYIKKAAPFAQPVLKQLRKVVHAGCPQVEEAIKWGVPFFMHHGILCGMAAFKAHCGFFGVWPGGGNPGKLRRIIRIDELPSDAVLKKLIERGARLNASGKKSLPSPKKAKQKLVVPKELSAALAKNKKARAAFDGFSDSARKEYVNWITDAKRDETRSKRLATAIEWLADGKKLNWKYEKR